MKSKEKSGRDPLNDTELITIFNLMYIFHMPYLDARACLRDGAAEKLVGLWIDFKKKAKEAREKESTGSFTVGSAQENG